jgi:hypothetical protein
MAHAPKTGGMMELGELRQKLIRSRGKSAQNQVTKFYENCNFLKKIFDNQ